MGRRKKKRRPKPDTDVVEKADAAPAPRPRIGVPYALVRFAHNTIDAALLPLALAWWLAQSPAPGSAERGAVGVLSFVACLFIVVLPQADYPTSLRGALVRTLPVVANVAAALWASQRDVLLSAWWSTSSQLAGLGLMLVVMAALGGRMLVKEKAAGPAFIAFIVSFFAGFGVLACIVVVLMLRPIAAPPGAWSFAQWVAAATWAVHAGMAVRGWVAMSVFSSYLKSDQSQERQALYERWIPVACVLLITSEMAVIIQLAW